MGFTYSSLSPGRQNAAMKTPKAGVEIWDLDGRGIRCALALDGVVRYVGARDQCVRRAEILAAANNRGFQDLMLVRALQ
jgi:hypothetical protein